MSAHTPAPGGHAPLLADAVVERRPASFLPPEPISATMRAGRVTTAAYVASAANGAGGGVAGSSLFAAARRAAAVHPADRLTPAALPPRPSVGADDAGAFGGCRRRAEDDRRHRRDPALRPITGFGFDLIDEADVVAQSVVCVSSPTAIAPQHVPTGRNGDTHLTAAPVRDGPLSLLMGPVERSTPCESCGGVVGDDYTLEPNPDGAYHCPGHFGHIEQPGAVFSVGYANALYSLIKHLMRCFCWTCGEMPATARVRASTIDAALRCSPSGEPLNRDQRIEIVATAMHAAKQCHPCRARLRCDECRERATQCTACARLVEFRPTVRERDNKSAGGSSGAAPTDFPQYVTWGADALTSDEERAQFAAFKRRHPSITVTELAFNPERARRMWSAIGPEVALLLAPELPRGPYDRSAADVYVRVYGRRPPAELDALRRAAVDAALRFFTTMAARATAVIPPIARPTRVNGSLLDVDHNEMTRVYTQILSTANSIRRTVERIGTADKPAAPPLVGALAPDARRRLAERDPAALLEYGAVLRHAPGSAWWELTLADHHEVAPLYGTLQYLVMLVSDPSQAPRWHPAGSSAPRPNSTKPGSDHTKDKAHAPMTNLRGKKGRLRENLLGKRVDFTMRNVITPDPELDIDEIGLAYWAASRWRFSDAVTDLNYQTLLAAAERRRQTMLRLDAAMAAAGVRHHTELSERVRERLIADPALDPDVVHMGRMPLYLWNAERTERRDYTQFKMPVYEHPAARAAGVLVDRPPRAGDYIALNRAPSLHVVSFMLHRIVLTTGHSTTINPNVTPPYNADFDGDEMNGHFLQSLGALAEARVLMPPSANVLLPRTSSPTIGQVQDALLGSMYLSLPGTLYSRADACELLYRGLNHRVTDDDPYGDARPWHRLPVPAVAVRCRGTGEHAAAGRCSAGCHAQHVAYAETCGEPCTRHRTDCAARHAAPDGCRGAPHWVPYWTGLQLVSMFLPRWFSAAKTDAFVPTQFGFTEPAAGGGGGGGSARERSDARDAARRPLSQAERVAMRHAAMPWRVVNGELLYGTLNKAAVGLGHRSITHQMLMSTGAPSPDDATGQVPERNRLAGARFMRGLSRLAVHSLTQRGFSVGLADTILEDRRARAQVALAVFGVRPPDVPSDAALHRYVTERAALLGRPVPPGAVLAEKLAIDPVKYGYPRFDLDADDARAVPADVLDALGVPHAPMQPGVERQVAALVQQHYAKEARYARGERDAEAALGAPARRALLEQHIRNACDKSRDLAHAAVAAAVSLRNGFCAMVTADSKGNWINIGSIMACVGLQSSNGRRLCDQIPPLPSGPPPAAGGGGSAGGVDAAAATSMSANPYLRWYAHTPRGTVQGAGAAGMVKLGYIDGCTPHDFFNQAYGGRDGLVDTAVKTAETGYAQRRLVKMFEGHCMAADGTVRNEANRVVSFSPGGARIDPRYLMSALCEPIAMRYADFCGAALLRTDADAALLALIGAEPTSAAAAAAREAASREACLQWLRALPDYDSSGGRLRVAGDLSNVLIETMHQCGCTSLLTALGRGYAAPLTACADAAWRRSVVERTLALGLTPLTVERCVATVDAWLADTEVARHDGVTLSHAALLLTAKQLIVRYQIPAELLDEALARYRRVLVFARAQTGDAIGVLTAQALGSPLTQMTLQTFYVAGREAPVTRGVPRFNELISMRITAEMRTPMAEVRFDMRRHYAEAAFVERCAGAPATRRAVLSALRGVPQLDTALADAATLLSRTEPVDAASTGSALDAVLAAVASAAVAQYRWTLDALFDDWALVGSTAAAAATVGSFDDASAASVYATMQRAGVTSALVARRRAAAPAPTGAQRAVLMANMAAAVVSATGTDVRFVCLPLCAGSEHWIGVAFVAFGGGAERARQACEAIRVHRGNIAVLYADDDRVLSAAGVTSWSAAANELTQEMHSAASSVARSVHIERNSTLEHREWLERSLLAPLRRTLPRVTLGSVLDRDAIIAFAPVTRYGDELRQSDDVPDSNADERASVDLFYGHTAMFDAGCRCEQCVGRGAGEPEPGRLAFSAPDVYCLGAFVLVLRLDSMWFASTGFSVQTLRDRVQAYLGTDAFSVFVGDANSAEYIPLHVRLHTCRLDALAARAYSGAPLAWRRLEQLQPTRAVVLHTEALLPAARAALTPEQCERERWQTADARADREPRPLTDPAFIHEMRISLGYVPSPDVLLTASRLTAALFAESLRLLGIGKAERARVPDELRGRFVADLERMRAWFKQAQVYADRNLPAPNRELPRLAPPDAPLAIATPLGELAAPQQRLLRTFERLVEWTRACLEFVDAHTPLWTLIAERRAATAAAAAARPPPPPRLAPALVDAVRGYFRSIGRRDPLGRRVTDTLLAPIDDASLRNEYRILRTQTEIDELTRVAVLLDAFCFTGTTAVGDVQTRTVNELVYLPESGAARAEQTIGDVATTDFAAVLALRDVDRERTTTNAPLEVARLLGIEAARTVLILQYADVFRMTGPHAASNHANLAHMAGVQTARGVCLPLSRQGAKELVEDRLQAASFEQAPVVVLHACVARARITDVRSPSSAMMLARSLPGFGTSASELYLDVAALLATPPLAVPPLEQTIGVVFPLPTGAPVVGAVDVATPARGATPAPGDTALEREARDLGIEQSGTFSPTRGASPAADSDDDAPPRLGLLARVRRAAARRDGVPDYSTTAGYDPSAPQLLARPARGPPPSSGEVYRPDAPALAPARPIVAPPRLSTAHLRSALRDINW